MEMSEIFKPMLVQAVLTIALGYWLVWARVGSLIRRKVKQRDIDQHGWQGWIKNAGDSFENQFEVPVIFFVLCFILYFMNAVSPLVMALAWAFVASRIVHALIHISVNHVPYRFLAFLLGCILVTVMLGITILSVF